VNLKAVERTLDSKGILNPGKVLQPANQRRTAHAEIARAFGGQRLPGCDHQSRSTRFS
jgi:hypothetical protein